VRLTTEINEFGVCHWSRNLDGIGLIPVVESGSPEWATPLDAGGAKVQFEKDSVKQNFAAEGKPCHVVKEAEAGDAGLAHFC
jgi:hypothetical protein